MPPEEQGLDLEQLKVDPRVWQRLATPLDGSNVLGNVFVDEKENPFQKDPKGSMAKIQSLAAAGKLYLRDLGRSRHFHKVEKDGDNLKLGEKHEMKLSNRNIDLPLSILMWATGKYLRSWGLESIPNWFDKKREERAAINKMEAQYKEEYKSLTSEQKKELKDLRKQEKQEAKAAKQEAKLQKKLDKLKKEAEKTQKKLDKLKNKNQEKSEEKAKKKAKKKTGRKNKKEIKEKETDPQQKAIDKEAQELQDFLDAPDIEKEVKDLEDFLNPPENPNLDNETGPLIDEEAHPDLIVFDDDVQQDNLNGQPLEELAAPLQNPPDLEAGKVNMQPQQESPEQAALRNRLIEEKEAMDAVANWRDAVANSLFSHEEASEIKEYYETLKGNKEAADEFLTGVVCGILTADVGTAKGKQQAIDALLSGKPLGSQQQELINAGVTAFNAVKEQQAQKNSKPLEDMIANSIQVLGKQASKETTLSSRMVMLGRLNSNAAKLADDYKLELPLSKDDWTIARGAFNLADLAQKQHDARQKLGAGPVDLSDAKTRNAVRDLVMGQAIENIMFLDQAKEEPITNTQLMMGQGLWSVENLQKMMSNTQIRKTITAEQVQTLLNNPNSLDAKMMTFDVVNEFIAQGEQLAASQQNDLQRNMQMEGAQLQQQENNQQQIEQPQNEQPQIEQPGINPMAPINA